jgi:hypothetical protein
MAEYDEQPTHDVNRWRGLAVDDATFWFTDGSFEGVAAIRRCPANFRRDSGGGLHHQ